MNNDNGSYFPCILFTMCYALFLKVYIYSGLKSKQTKQNPKYFIDSIETVWSKIDVLEDKKKSIRRQNLKKVIANGKMTLKSK